MNEMWMIDIDTALVIYELAMKHGKKPGDDCQAEFDEVRKQFPEKFKYMGTTNKDKDIITGDLREEGFKVTNLDEEIRKKKNEQTDI